MKCKLVTAGLGALAVLFICGACGQLQAQDYMDVPQGYETLNLAIEGDTTAAGLPASPDRVYRLERGGYYLLNGALENIKGNHLRVEAAEGDEPMPILISIVGETGTASRPFHPVADATIKGIYISGIDNLGNLAEQNMFRADPAGGRFILDGLFMDYDDQNFFRMNAENQKLYITNCIFRNSFRIANPGNGRMVDTRSNTQDTIFVQNCTWYVNSNLTIRSGGGIIKNVIVDHCTFYQNAEDFELYRAIHCTFTNNVLVDFGFEGHELGDTTDQCVIPIDSLLLPGVTEDQRTYKVTNNVLGFTPELTAWLDGKDSLEAYTWHDIRGQRFIAANPNMVSENNIIENPQFSDPPDPNTPLAYAEHRFVTNRSNENNPDIRADRNGRAALDVDPLSVGPAPDEYDFDYSTTSQAYTHAEGGFPVGDLNWFPDKKAEWEVWKDTGIAKRGAIPDRFTLEQNFPNPFNPATTIYYNINKESQVELTIHNTLGQQVRRLVAEKQGTGAYSVEWDGLSESGDRATSGVYFYRLKAGEQVQIKKMLMVK